MTIYKTNSGGHLDISGSDNDDLDYGFVYIVFLLSSRYSS